MVWSSHGAVHERRQPGLAASKDAGLRSRRRERAGTVLRALKERSHDLREPSRRVRIDSHSNTTRPGRIAMNDLTLLLLRATVGGLLAGHGARTLRGRFGGPGLAATSDQVEMLGL